MADLLIKEWGLQSHPQKRLIRRVLGEMHAEAQLILRNEPKLQVEIHPKAPFSVWAFFPAHRRRFIVIRFNLQLKPTTRVLLLLSTKHQDNDSQFQDHLRDHLGHVLLYLQSPRSRNECQDAEREWRQACA